MVERRQKKKKKKKEKRNGEVIVVEAEAKWLTWLKLQGKAFPGYAERRVLRIFGNNPLHP